MERARITQMGDDAAAHDMLRCGVLARERELLVRAMQGAEWRERWRRQQPIWQRLGDDEGGGGEKNGARQGGGQYA